MNRRLFTAPSIIGFDRLMRGLEESVEAQRAQTFPPYNLIRTAPNAYKVVVALAGFAPEEITIETEEGVLVVAGSKVKDGDDAEYIHRGLAVRDFARRFNLADHIEVRGASFEHGLLTITFERVVPESQKKRSIPINAPVPALEAAE